MFRRNKSKGAKANKYHGDDMVALTGPDVLSSSSGAERTISKSKSKGILGRRKKKNGAAENNVSETATSSNAAATNIAELNLGRGPQTQPQHAQESAPQAMPRKNVGVTGGGAGDKHRRPQPQQPRLATKQPQQQSQYANALRDDKSGNMNRQSSSKNPSLPSSDVHGSRAMPGTSSFRDVPPNMAVVPGASKPPANLVIHDGGSSTNNAAPTNGDIPMLRSGWSMQSSASSAMNSENYIQSLDNPPTLRSGKAFPILSAQPDDRIHATLSDDRIRTALSRQFGRKYPSQAYHQKWFVKVGQPRWDDEQGRYKYKIKITQNPSIPETDSLESSSVADSYSHLSFASTSTSRSLQDFVWLEQALRAEYHGALIVPLLSLALYFGSLSDNATTGEDESLASRSLATDFTSKGTIDPLLVPNGGNIVPQSFRFLDEKIEHNEVVDENLLANWLSDIINGVRGNGEVLLDNGRGVVKSEAMETFLYRHSETRDGFGPSQMGSYQRASSLGSPFNNLFSINDKCRDGDKSLFESFMENPFECFGMESACGPNKKKTAQDLNRKMPLSMMCSSGATGVPGIGHCNSYLSQSEAEVDLSWLQTSSRIATHSELLEAERDLIASYLKSSSLAMSMVQSLTKDEAYVGDCWKRFAISLSNLFSVEKDLEQAHIGDQIKSNKKKQPFRKLRKSVVDDALRNLARAKIERSNPSLRTLGTMLHAYYADLNSVVPAFREYSEAINHLHELDDINSIKSYNQRKISANNKRNNEWHPLEHLKILTWGVTRQITGGESVVSAESDPTAGDDLSTLGSLSTAQTKVLQKRVLVNEKLLKFSITVLCRASPLRNARMAWWYLKTEAKQALNVHTAATALRQKLSIDKDAATVMKERKYEEEEKRDTEIELVLVKRILDLGSSDYMSDEEAARQNAIRIATEQVGRWNAKAALALMAAAGVEDAQVQIDETSRELRHVRKYAISLRENVARCLESAEALASSFILNAEGGVQISRSRREFWAAISAVFSGKIISEEATPNIGTLSMRVLSSAGIDVTDRGGWLGHNPNNNQTNQQRRNCGEVARQYLKKRDNQANTLISRICKLLKDYERRLEGIESFVYMHCVGIQLEKHCSRARSKALSAWEKRTDISTAINVATKKKIPKLVQELKVKLDALPQVSHTTVLKRKEEHLASKTLKSDLHKLANRRFGRAQEVSTERVIAVMSLWAKHEESVAMEEVEALGEAVQEVELSLQSVDVDAVLDTHSSDFGRDSAAKGNSLM
ncbi:hypothetical protein ACHAXR_007721 [Thalassiosira sp. AJA248-18]